MPARRLLFLHHAKSAWDDSGASDYDRPLAPRGHRAAAVMGVYIRDEGLTPDLVLSSAAKRAHDTWDIVAAALKRRPEVEYDPGLYMVTPERLLKRLRKAPDSATSPAARSTTAGSISSRTVR